MKTAPSLLVLSILCFGYPSGAGEAGPALLSPDGRFRFEAFSEEEVEAGRRPAFGIVETASGRLVSDPGEELGDASRPEETLLWAPDSLSYALTTRVGTRHLDTYLYRWDGKAFVRAKWEGGGQLEAWADDSRPSNGGLGQCLRGDRLAERWLDGSRLILRAVYEYESGDATVAGSARALVKWDPDAAGYVIQRRLPLPNPWPARLESTDYQITQIENPDQADLVRITVTSPDASTAHSFEAENSLPLPILLAGEGPWPVLELASAGPAGFEWRRIHRFGDGAYRCVRVVALTHLPSQAPDEAPLFELGEGRTAFLLADRVVSAGEPDSYESFQTETLSPEGAWKALFTYHPQYLQRLEIVAMAGGGEPAVIYDFDEGTRDPGTVFELRWQPDGEAFSLDISEPESERETLLYRRQDRVWSRQ